MSRCSHSHPTRLEKVEGVRRLYIDHGRRGCPYVLRWKEGQGETKKQHEKVLGCIKPRLAKQLAEEFGGQDAEERERGTSIKCDEAFNVWIAAGVKTRGSGLMSKRTVKLYKSLWRNWAKKRIGRKRVSQVQVGDIIAILDDAEAAGRSRHQPYVMLSSFFHAMTMEPYRHRKLNPVSQLGTKKPAAPDSEAVEEDAVMTRSEIEAIIKGIPSRWEIHRRQREMLIRLGYLTGLRLSELLGLVWECVDLHAGEVKVTRQLEDDFDRNDRDAWFSQVKGKTTRLFNTARIVPLDDEAIGLLISYRQWALDHDLYHGEDSLLFMTPGKQTPLRQDCMSEMFTKAVKTSGLTRYPWTFHCLRHSFASLVFETGGDHYEVAKLLGNHPEVARKRYIHLGKRDAYNETFRARRRAALDEAAPAAVVHAIK